MQNYEKSRKHSIYKGNNQGINKIFTALGKAISKALFSRQVRFQALENIKGGPVFPYFNIESGSDIPIEERQSDEITSFWKFKSSDDYDVFNPAFDVTPNSLISAIITEKGIIHNPVKDNLKNYN